MECTVQIAELAFPFPAETLATELTALDIRYRMLEKESAQGMGAAIFFVASKDLDMALDTRDRVETEFAISEQKHKHPIWKYSAIIALFGWIVWTIYKLVESMN